ncbi:MAG: transketolase [Calditrichota bacterium]
MSSALDNLCINTIRTLSIDIVQKANSGHPGLPMGAAAMAYVLWTRHLRHNPENPQWINRDRFVLSAGHGSAMLYALLHLTGYKVSLEDLQNFRQWDSITPGHPEAGLTPGVEATTGPLGQGVGNIVGMAIAREHLAARFNRDGNDVIDYRVFGICSDGDLMEGVASEAASLAGHLALGGITMLYDDNRVTIDGHTNITFTEDVGKRFESYGWHVVRADGLNTDEVDAAIQAGIAETQQPTLIICRTTIGYGSPNKADSPKVHGSPLGAVEVVLTKKALNWPEDRTFYVPKEAFKHFRSAVQAGKQREAEWRKRVDEIKGNSPDFAKEWDSFWKRELPEDWAAILPAWKATDRPIATRKASQLVMNAVSPKIPNLMGGSADLAESNLTYLEKAGDFSVTHRAGRNIRFGIREHGMGAILNGMALSAPFIPFGSTFLTFADYMKPAMRIAALSHLPVVYVFTHDSIGLGEDGPTHQPIEQIWSLRATPNLFVFRPADPNETTVCWKLAMERTDGPSAIILTRQNVPVLDPAIYGKLHVEQGAYILAEASNKRPDVILLATGSEISLALAARERLEQDGIAVRVVSMPCLELFDAQPEHYRNEVLPPSVVNRIAIEAGATAGWWKYAGIQGDVIGLDRFGASAPAEILFEKFGFTPEAITERVRTVVQRNRSALRGVK